MEEPKITTYFASAERSTQYEIESSYHALKNNPLLRMFQEAMPDLAMIVNKNRQLVYANTNLIKFLDIEDSTRPLGQRLGELIGCINSNKNDAGCGTSNGCRFCGIVNAIIESQTSQRPVVKEARITALIDNETTSFDLKVKASPLIYQDEDFTIISINDISDRKRRAILETSYVNEMYHTASELNTVVSAIKKTELDSENRTLIENAEKVNYEMINDLLAQKMLNQAEEGSLQVKQSMCNSIQCLRELENYITAQEFSEGKKLFIDPFSHNVRFLTDTNILSRVLINIMTNAFEATPAGKIIKAGVRLKDKIVCYWITSVNELSDEARHQIFQRSYSTKGPNHGLGTYSARLLVTKYLKGQVYFKSDKSNGTTFYIEVPLH